jgi:hypothetical protein
MSVMRTGVLLCLFLSAVCLAGQPTASTQVAADTGSASFHQRTLSFGGHASFRAALLNSRFDTTRGHDTLLRRAGFPNPFLDRFLTSAGFTAASYGQWHKGLYLRGAAMRDGRLYQNPSLNSLLLNEFSPYNSRAMKKVGDIAYWVVPFLLPMEDREAFMPQRFDPQPGRHGWPYH